MKYQRKFVIKIATYSDAWIKEDSYVKDFIKNSIGYYYTTTHIIENAKVWRYKKTCENSINLFLKNFDATKIKNINDYNLKITEITDNQILRGIKLNKINKLKKDEV